METTTTTTTTATVEVPITVIEEKKEEAPKCEMYSVGEIPHGEKVKGYDFNQGVDYKKLFESYATTGLQANSLSDSMKIVNQAIDWRLSDEPLN